MRMFLNGTAMSGQPDHVHLLGAPLLGPARTAPAYRFYAVRDEFPGLVPDATGTSIAGELYDIDDEVWVGSLGPAEPAELVLGTIELADGSAARAMLLDPAGVPEQDLTDITALGGWRAHLERRGLAAPRARTS